MKNNKKNAPAIRFPGFTAPWEQRKLEAVAKYRNGKAHENDISENGKYIVVNSKFVSTDGDIRKYTDTQIEPLFKDEIAFVLSDVPNGRAIARTFLVDESNKYTLNQRIAGITPLENTYPYFLHILMNRNRYFLAFDDGVKQTNLSVSDVMNFEVMYPAYNEQEKIGTFFEQIDNAITLHQWKCDELKNYKKGLLQQMFPQPGESFPRVRFPGFTDSWEQRALGDCCGIFLGLTYTPEYVEDGITFISSKNISNDYLDLSDHKFISENEFNSSSSNAKPIRGDILFTRVGSNLGHPVVVETDEKLCIFVSLGYLRVYDGINNYFMKQWMNSDDFKRQLFQKTGGGAKINVNTGWLKTFNFSYPVSIEEQKMIGSFLLKIDNFIALQQRKCDELKVLKKGLFQQMFV